MSSPLKLIASCVATGGGAILTVLLIRRMSGYISSRNLRLKIEERCKTWPKDVVILHGMRRGKLTPNPSPFVLKLETFLRMHKIPYIFDSEFPKGEKGKMPWITLNGEHYTDSQLIIKFLSEKYSIKSTTSEDKTLQGGATMARVMMDEHFFWGLLLWRYVYAKGQDLDKIFNMSPSELKAFEKLTYSKYMEFSWYQGSGRHSEVDVTRLMSDDLRALSSFLGSRPYLIGDEPCDEDCAVFGMLSQLVWNDVGSPYANLIENELQNLKEYCFRMKEKFWPDWDEIIKATA